MVGHPQKAKAKKKLQKHVEDLLRDVKSHFSRNYGRQVAFQEFQEFFHVKIHKILSSSATCRLLAKQCVDRILEQCESLKGYFTEVCFLDLSYTNQTIPMKPCIIHLLKDI